VMRGGRSFLVLLVLALGLGAYIYFVESKRDPSEAEKKAKVFTVDPAKIEVLEVHSSSGAVTTLKKTSDHWAIVSPAPAPVDEPAVTSLVDALGSMQVDKVLDENPTALAPFVLLRPLLLRLAPLRPVPPLRFVAPLRPLPSLLVALRFTRRRVGTDRRASRLPVDVVMRGSPHGPEHMYEKQLDRHPGSST